MRKGTVVALAINVAVMICAAGLSLHQRNLAISEQRDFYDSGDAVEFALFLAPVLFFCLVTNIVWTGVALLSAFRWRNFKSVIPCFITLLLWLVIVLVGREYSDLPPNPAFQRTAPSPLN